MSDEEIYDEDETPYGDYENFDDNELVDEIVACEELLRLTNDHAWQERFIPWITNEMSAAILILESETSPMDAVRAAQGHVRALKSILILPEILTPQIKEMQGELDHRRHGQK